MSDAPQGPGWWKANDGRWYAPQAPKPPPAPPPPQSYRPPPPARKKGGFLRWVGIIALVLLGIGVITAVAGGGDDEGDKPADSSATPATSPDEQPEVFTLGQTAHTGDFDVTLTAVQDGYTSSNEFDNPDEGHRYVAVEFLVRNTTDEQQTLGTFFGGAEVTDSQSRPWDPAFTASNLPGLGGTVAAGESRKGWIIFEVANDATDLRVRIKGNFTAKGSVFALT